jgi:hypothetical protein
MYLNYISKKNYIFVSDMAGVAYLSEFGSVNEFKLELIRESRARKAAAKEASTTRSASESGRTSTSSFSGRNSSSNPAAAANRLSTSSQQQTKSPKKAVQSKAKLN